MNIIATPKSKFEKTVKKCAVSPLNGNNNYVFIHYVFFGNDFLAGEVWFWSFEFNRGPKLLVKRSRASNMGGLGSEQKQKNATTLSVSINNDKRNPMIKIMVKSFGKWPEKKVNSEKIEYICNTQNDLWMIWLLHCCWLTNWYLKLLSC